LFVVHVHEQVTTVIISDVCFHNLTLSFHYIFKLLVFIRQVVFDILCVEYLFELFISSLTADKFKH